MAQQFIDFGTFPNDPSADPLRAAFQKIQNNFTDLYNTQLTAGVLTLNVGPGLSTNSNVGNILLQTSFPNITIQTANSLLVGVGAATSNTATISNYNQKFVINLANTITTQNANFTVSTTTANLLVNGTVNTALNPNSNVTLDIGNSTNRWRTIFLGANGISIGTRTINSNANGIIIGNLFTTTGNITSASITTGNIATLNVSNINVTGYVTSNFIPSLNEVYDLGNNTHRFKDLWLSGNSLRLGTATINDDGAGGITINSAVVTSNLSVGNLTAVYLDGTITSSSQPNITTVGILNNLAVSGNILTGELSVTGNLEAANLNTTGTITATNIEGNIILPPGTTLQAPGSNTQILFNDGGNTSAVSGMTFNKTTNLLSISGNVAGGNLVTSGGLSVSGNGSIGNLSASGSLNATGNVNAGNLITVGVLASTADFSGNVTTNGFLSVVGNASVGNITTTTLTGQIVSVSGNVSGANLVASGVLRVDGNANVGNLTTSGFVSAATIAAAANVSAGNFVTSGSLSAGTLNVSGAITSNSTINLTGNATLGNTTTQNMTVNGSLTGAALMESGLLNVVGNMTGGNVITNGFLSVAGNANIGNIVSQGISANGTVTAGSFTTSGNLSAANGNISSLIITSVINASGATANVNTLNSSILSVVGNASAGNLATGGTLSVSGNATTGNLATGGLQVSGNFTVAGTSTTVNSTLNVTGNLTGSNANINNLEVASFAVTTANASNVNISGILSMPSGTATIGNIAAGILAATGNVSGSNLIASGYLAVSGDASANKLTVSSGIVNGSYAVGGQITVGSNVQITTTGSSGNGTVAVLAFTTAQDAAPFPAGSSIIVSGLAPSGFNGTYSVASSNTTHVTYANPTNGPVTTGGFVRSSGVGMVLQGSANVGSLVSAGDISGANVTGSTFTATLFSGNGASITGINMFNTGMRVTITATAGTGSVQTLSFASQSYPPFTPGQSVTVSGVTPTGYNGTYTVLTCTTTAVTMSGSATGTMTVSGTISGGAKAVASTLSENVVNGSQPNITSVGTLTGLSLSGAFTGTDITSSGFVLVSVQSGIAAAGTTLGTATPITKQVNVVTTAAAGTADGIRLPAPTVGMQITIINRTSVPIKVYPANGGTIDTLAINASFSLGINARLIIVATSTTQWFTMVGVYG
jgi:hypothetical protein